MLSTICPIIFILSPLALRMFAFLAACTGSPCASAMLPVMIVVVDPVSGKACRFILLLPASSNKWSLGVGP